MKTKLASLLLIILAISMVLSGCQTGTGTGDGADSTTDNSSNGTPEVFESNGIIAIRLQPAHESFEESLEALLKMPGACDEIWLSVNFQWSTSEIGQYAIKLSPYIKKIKAAGIRVVLETATLGHAADGQGNYPYEKLVGSDGYQATSAYCPGGENFRKHMVEAITMFAALKPYAIYFDDDFRLDNRGPATFGCFCQNCVNEFNTKYGTSYTSATVAKAIVTDLGVREKYIAMNKKHLADLAGAMAEAAVKAHKDIYIGLENCYHNNYLGDDINEIYEAIHNATGKAVFTRPGGYFYHDLEPLELFDKVLNNSWATSLLPDYVEIRRHESENANHTVMGKSLGGTLVEATIALAYGCNSLSFSMCQSGNEPIATREAMWQAFIDYRDFWQDMIDDQTTADGEATGVAGLRLAYFGDMWKLVVKGDSATRMFWATPKKESGRDVIEVGLPITYEDDFSSAYLLHPDIVDSLTDDNIKFLLTQNVYTDGATIDKLIKRGFGDQLPTTTVSKHVSETYTDHAANGNCAGLTGMLDGKFGASGVSGRIFSMKSNCEALAYVTGTKNVSSVLIKTKAGSTWIADGLDLWASIMNGVRRSRMSIVAQYLSGDMLPARLESDDRIALIVRAEKDGTFVSATLQNITVGDSYPIVVAVKAPKDAKFVFSRPKMADVVCSSEYKDGEHFVTVPSLAAWQTGVLRVQSK